ncbi:MAG: hypothetical protein RSC68_26405 [Acinetobacter sp.]
MHIDFVTADGACIMSTDSPMVTMPGDVLVMPNNKAFTIMQRAFIATEEPVKLVEIGAPRSVELHVQCLCRAIESAGKSDAIKS